MTHFNVSFDGTAPDEIKVGDKLTIQGAVQVRAITAGLVDITSYGRDPEYALGEITVDLVSNKLEVTAMITRQQPQRRTRRPQRQTRRPVRTEVRPDKPLRDRPRRHTSRRRRPPQRNPHPSPRHRRHHPRHPTPLCTPMTKTVDIISRNYLATEGTPRIELSEHERIINIEYNQLTITVWIERTYVGPFYE